MYSQRRWEIFAFYRRFFFFSLHIQNDAGTFRVVWSKLSILYFHCFLCVIHKRFFNHWYFFFGRNSFQSVFFMANGIQHKRKTVVRWICMRFQTQEKSLLFSRSKPFQCQWYWDKNEVNSSVHNTTITFNPMRLTWLLLEF